MVPLNFEKLGGLVPAIIQDLETGDVLMLGFMNEEAWKKTRETGRVHFYSRSRQKLWMKGETSGNTQTVKEIYVDCDEDSVLLKVKQQGTGACHKGYVTCFSQRVVGNQLELTQA